MDFTRIRRYRELVEDWPGFLDAVQAPLPSTLWVNELKIQIPELRAELRDEGIDTEPIHWYRRGLRVPYEARPGKTLAFVTGCIQIQEEVSMMPIHFLDPRPGERVLDLCAAPGNKTAQMSLHMDGTGTVVANDINRRRLGMVMRNVDRLGLTNVVLLSHNGSNLPSSLGTFDRVLADVPCSCEGTTRKNPDLLWSEPPDPARYARGQVAILRKAVQRCRPGGRIVYSTCTYAPEENEAVVHQALEEFDDLRVLPARLEGFRGAPGLTEWQGRTFRPELEQTLRVYPHLNDTGGFYIALLERTEAEKPEPAPVDRPEGDAL